MKLALDHHYSPAIAQELRTKAHDVVVASEKGWESDDDETLLESCHRERRALLTNNVGDFAVISRQWLAEGRAHHGLIFTSDASMPRSRGSIGRYVAALEELFDANPGDDALVDRIVWL